MVQASPYSKIPITGGQSMGTLGKADSIERNLTINQKLQMLDQSKTINIKPSGGT